MRTIFIADAHLQHPDDDRYQAMLRFLDELRGSTEILYIMGDFFEFWLGYPVNPFTHYQPVLDSLQRLHASGTRIVYFEGNHDFHMGPFFTETLHAKVYPGPADLQIAGRRTFLCHGDQANPADIPYRLLRLVFHSSFTRWLAHRLPPAVSCTIADRMGRKGREYLQHKGDNPVYLNILEKHAAGRFAEGFDTVISGHFHIPFTKTYPTTPPRLLISLGAWAAGLYYAELVGSEIQLRTFA